MSADLIDALNGTVAIEVVGMLTPAELASVHRQAALHLSEWGGGCMLVLAERFEGWSDDPAWESLDFQTANDPLVRKMAIVGDTRWEQLAHMFTARGLRPFPIEFFPAGKESEARHWLKE
ncbi:MAG: hypothetical protein RLZZ505_1540 [Verrucomicrobiota bacterium]|jgi:hypothetical protein